MKTVRIAFLLLAASTLFAAPEPKREKESELPRLTDVGAFPEKDRPAVRAIIAAVSADGGKPGEYFLELTPTKDGQIDVYLKHESHPADDLGSKGDVCSHCRVTRYDPKTEKVGRFYGIR